MSLGDLSEDYSANVHHKKNRQLDYMEMFMTLVLTKVLFQITKYMISMLI